MPDAPDPNPAGRTRARTPSTPSCWRPTPPRGPRPSPRSSTRCVRATTASWKGERARGAARAVEPPGESRDRFGAALAALLAETDATNLVACAGIPGHRGFFSEFGDRLANRILPAPADERDLRELVHRLYGSEAGVRGVRRPPAGPLPPRGRRVRRRRRLPDRGTAFGPPSRTVSACSCPVSKRRGCRRRSGHEPAPDLCRHRRFTAFAPRARPCWRRGSKAAIRRTPPCGSGRSRANAARRPASSSSISRAPASASTSSSRWR